MTHHGHSSLVARRPPAGSIAREGELRLAALILAVTSVTCTARPAVVVGDAPECERGCRAIESHCSDDSAKERQPDATTCNEDFRGCMARCADEVSGDPAARAAVEEKERETSFIERLIQGNSLVPFVPSGK